LKPVSLSKKIGISGIHVLQILLLTAVGMLQRYTRLRPMLMRHLYTRNLEYSEAFFTDGLRLVQSGILLFIGIGVLWILVRRREELRSLTRVEGIILPLLCLLIISFVNLAYFQGLITYSYWIFAGYLLLSLQGVVIRISR